MKTGLIIGDCRDVLGGMPTGSVRCTATSPPFKAKDGYSDSLIDSLARHLFRVHRNDTICWVNFNVLKGEQDPRRADRLRWMFLDAGWKEPFTKPVIWFKCGHYTPLTGENLDDRYEYIYVFVKGSCPNIERRLMEYDDDSNTHRWARGKKCPGNIWPYDYQNIQSSEEKDHPDRMPAGIIRRCLQISNLPPRAVVLDPFDGSGTTRRVARNMGFREIGIEKYPERARRTA